MAPSPLNLSLRIGLLGLVVLVGVALWNPAGDFWHGVEFPKAQCEAYDATALKAATTLSESVYAPEKLARLFREPQNTVSNLAYAVVGLAILLAGRRPASRALGCAGIILGWGSGIYHALLLPEWRMIDILGVYAVLFCLLLVGAVALVPWFARRAVELSGAILTWGFAIYTGVHRNDVRIGGVKIFDSTYVMVVSVALGCLLALLASRRASNRARYWRAVAVLAVTAPLAFIGGQGDRYGGFLASPQAIIQGHAMWHVLGAVTILAAYEVFAATGFDRSTLTQERVPTN